MDALITPTVDCDTLVRTITRVASERKSFGYLITGIPLSISTVRDLVDSIRREQPCFVSLVGLRSNDQIEELRMWAQERGFQELEFGFGATHAVNVRNYAPRDGLKLAIVWKEEERLHSLTHRGYSEIGPREVIEVICESGAQNAPNEPQKNLWRALAVPELSAYISLEGILAFRKLLSEGHDGPGGDLPRKMLSVLELLPDSQLLSGRWVSQKAIVDRLVQNAEMVQRIQRADDEDRKTLMQRLRESPDDVTIKEAYNAYVRIARGDKNALKELDLPVAIELLTSSRVSRNTGATTSSAQRSGSSSRRLFDSLEAAVVHLTWEGSTDEVQQLIEKAHGIAEKNDSFSDRIQVNNVEVRFHLNPQILTIVDELVRNDRFGGVLQIEDLVIEDAIGNFGRCRDKIEFLDDVVISQLKHHFAKIKENVYEGFEGLSLFESYLESRERLLPFKQLLSISPIAFLVANPEVLEVARQTIESYERLLNHLATCYPQVIARSVRTRGAFERFLTIDTLRILGGKSGVILLPLHPLNLWKYVEYASLIVERGHDLDDQEREILLDDIENIPEPLLAFLCPVEDSHDLLKLSYAKRIGTLALYLPRTVEIRDVQESTITTAATKLAALYPFVKNNLRILLINPNSLQPVGKSLSRLVEQENFHHITLIVARIAADRAPIVEKRLEPFFEEGRLSIEEVEVPSIDALVEQLSVRPVHITVLAGVQEKGVDTIYSEETRLHPLSLPHRITVDPFDATLQLEPRSMQPADGGPQHPYGSYLRLTAQLSGHPRSEHAQRTRPAVSRLDAKKLLPYCQFLVVAGSVTDFALDDGVLRLTSGSSGQQDAVFTIHKDRFLHDIDHLLRQLNYEPTEQGISKILERLQRTGGDGLFATISEKGEGGFSRERLRGQLAFAVALEWYRENAADQRHTILSLDSPLARKWLLRRDSGRRSDFLAIRETPEGELLVEVLEVKGYEASSDSDEAQEHHFSQQLSSIANLIEVMLRRQGDLLVDRRREILRKQVFDEGLGFSDAVDPDWVKTVDGIIDGDVPAKVVLRLIEVVFDENISSTESVIRSGTSEDHRPIHRVRLGEPMIQRYLGRIGARSARSPIAEVKVPDIRPDETAGSRQFYLDDEVNVAPVAVVAEDSMTCMVKDSSDRIDPMTYRTNASESKNESDEVQTGFEPDDEERALIEHTARDIYRILQDVGIQLAEPVDPTKADVGPSVVRYKVRLQVGERVSNLKSRASDLMRELALGKEPIIDNLPNTKYVYIDLPRPRRRPALLRPVLESFEKAGTGLTVPVGVTPEGKVHTLDITALPHMLVGGTTGSGKTMFLYSIIISLVYMHTPAEVELLLVDPKQTDFVFFNELPHLRSGRVIAEPEEAIAALMDLLNVELSARTAKLANTRSKNLQTHNARFPHEALPPIVVVIDEFADLVDVMSKTERQEFEHAVKRLAQRARNVGIHLVLATQRPTTEVVTGNLKTNLPCRVSFRLASQIDSRTILDQGGAEHLLGGGDMLLSWNGELHRLQGFLVPDDDIDVLLAKIPG